MQLNYFGALHIVKAALPDMIKRKSGQIVFVSSAAAVCGKMQSLHCKMLMMVVHDLIDSRQKVDKTLLS
jgi:NADP-dependent 3-hydroxy acid dehydrogenase YdfG